MDSDSRRQCYGIAVRRGPWHCTHHHIDSLRAATLLSSSSAFCSYVRPEHRRKGLARACAVALCRALIKRGWTPLVHIEKSNAASTALFTSLGFKATREVSWLVCFPRAPKHQAWTKKAFGLGEEGSSTGTASDSKTGSS